MPLQLNRREALMGLFDQLTNALSNTSGQDETPEGMPAILAEVLGGESTGGMAGLVEKFQSAGFGMLKGKLT